MRPASFFSISLLPMFSFAAVTYCVPVAKFDLNPYREIKDGKEIAYLTPLTMPLISGVEGNPGVLSEYEFSPDGSSLHARLRPNLKWPSGASLTADQVALAIVRTLSHRPLGKRVSIDSAKRVVGLADLKKSSAYTAISDREFKLRFKSSIANLTGVLREALSSNSRPNRVWLWRKVGDSEEILSRIPVVKVSHDQILTRPHGVDLVFVSETKCPNADLTIYPEATGASTENSTFELAPGKSAVVALLNSARLNFARRKEVAEGLSASFKNASNRIGITFVDRFFMAGEPGYSNAPPLPSSSSIYFPKLNVYVEIPIFKAILSEHCKHCTFTSTLKPTTDVQLLSSAIIGGRLVALQDLLDWNGVGDFLVQSPKTTQILKRIAMLSASTIPPDNVTLQSFAASALEEYSFVPLARRQIAAYSKNGSPIVIGWDSESQVIFKQREKK